MENKISVQEYEIALSQNKLMGLKCKDCGFVTAPPRMACRKCFSHNTEVVQLSGKGTIVTYTTIFVPTEHRRGQTPYVVIMVELEEGPWLMGNIVEFDPKDASLDLIGKKVAMVERPVTGEKIPDEGIAPIFKIVD
jgi:uncharacterized OB-fold protein